MFYLPNSEDSNGDEDAGCQHCRQQWVADIAKRAVEGGASAEDANLHVLSAALVSPSMTPEQIMAMRDANVEGEAFVAELMTEFINLRRGVDAPFSRAS